MRTEYSKYIHTINFNATFRKDSGEHPWLSLVFYLTSLGWHLRILVRKVS